MYEPAEDSELLVRVLMEREPAIRGWAADVGTGSGIIARQLAASGARVVRTDINPHAALDVRCDLASALRGPFEVVAFNAPYLPSAPEERVEGWLDHAFHGGEGGIEVSARLVRDLPRILAPGGRAYLVVSSRAELETLAGAIGEAGFHHESVGSVRFFFEEVAVWRLTRNG